MIIWTIIMTMTISSTILFAGVGTPTRMKIEHATSCGHSPPAAQTNVPNLIGVSPMFGIPQQNHMIQQYHPVGQHYIGNPSFQQSDFQRAALFGELMISCLLLSGRVKIWAMSLKTFFENGWMDLPGSILFTTLPQSLVRVSSKFRLFDH